jgi:hypothetical protein
VPRRVQAPGNVGAVHIPDTADRRWCAVRGWAAAWGRRPPHLIRLAFFHRHDGEQHLASLPPARPTKSRRTGERTGRPAPITLRSPTTAPPAPRRSNPAMPTGCIVATMDLKAQGLRRSPAAPTARPQAAAPDAISSRPRRRRRGRAWPTSGPLNVPARPTHGRGTGRPVGGPGWSRRSSRAPAPVPSIPLLGPSGSDSL